MQNHVIRTMLALPLAALASPAFAQGGSFILPEPNPVTLISLGLAGLIVGRRLAFKKSKD
ncbi:MAG: PEP-CTERM sorting domain-containing protein [Sphingomonadaceae bacterium]|jgi:hypothetical protein